MYNWKAPLSLRLQGLDDLDVGIEESVQTVLETLILTWCQCVGGDGSVLVTLLEAHVCEVVD